MADFRSFVASLSLRARWAFAIGLAAIIAFVAGAAWWVMHPAYAVLVHDLRPGDASEIASALSEWGVPYRFGGADKELLVPDEQVYSTRMRLAAEGIPKGGSLGFEAFKDSDYGVTEFAQRVNYQRALQGELERTIASMQEVLSARVHLTMRRAGLFEKDRDPSKASVTLVLRDGQRLSARQVSGIQRLVASAVEGLEPPGVTVLDQNSAVLSGYGADGVAASLMDDRVDEAAKLERTLRQRVGELIARALHRNDFTVSVAVQLNYDRVKRVQERLLAQGKDGNGLLVREKIDTSHAPGDVGPDVKPGPAATHREAEYAHGREQEEIEMVPGRIDRITVGVVIPQVLPAAEIAKLDGVIAAGIGLDTSRGDRVDIAAVQPWSAFTPVAVGNATGSRRALGTSPPSSLAPAVSSAAKRAATSTRWAYPVSGVVVLLLGTLLLAVRRKSPARLSAPEREAALARIRQWIESPEGEA